MAGKKAAHREGSEYGGKGVGANGKGQVDRAKKLVSKGGGE